MIHLHYSNKKVAAQRHYEAVLSYVKSKSKAIVDQLYADIRSLFEELPEDRNEDDFDWLKRFILADSDTLDSWVAIKPELLKFTIFRQLYINRFARGTDKYVDTEKTYNAYTLLELIDSNVCPYCDDEYFDVIDIDGIKKRTCEFDHFHAKNPELYPALAMCFFNLVPSGQACNGLKNDDAISANPYDEHIEEYSLFVQDTPPGKILESLQKDEIRIKLLTTGKMTRNEAVLGLEERYNHRTDELRRIFQICRDVIPLNIEEKERLGFSKNILELIFGKPYPESRGNVIHQKLFHDLIGH